MNYYIHKSTQVICRALDAEIDMPLPEFAHGNKDNVTLLEFSDGSKAWFLNRWVVRDFTPIENDPE